MADDHIAVLLVEDDEDDYLITSDLLDEVQGTAYDITWCTGFRAMQDLLESDPHRRFDVCLIDFRLNAHSGLDVLEYLNMANEDLPCVMLTGRADSESDRRSMALGAADYLVKGRFDSEAIERSIRYAIDNARVMRSLRESEARFRSVVESATDGIVLLDGRLDIVAANRAAKELVGLADTNVLGRSCLDFLTQQSMADLAERFEFDMEAFALVEERGQEIKSTPLEAHIVHHTDRLIPVELTASSWVSGGLRYWSVIIRDVTERKALSDRLAHQAFHDPLTGLANRTLLKDRVTDRLRTLGRGGLPALIFVDLDNFKLINDTFGHDAGDELLIEVARRLAESVRDTDVVARMGGDEFAVFLDAADPRVAGRVADRLIGSLTEPVKINGIPVVASGSAGVAFADDPATGPEDLLRNADMAMYSAKSSGKNRVAIFESSMHDASIERVRIEHDLRSAIADDALGVAYQPIVDLRTLRIHGFEALARWSHPERGDVPPLTFVGVAEDAGLIEELGRVVMRRALSETAGLQADHGVDYGINVNLSTRQLDDPALVGSTRQLLAETGLVKGTLTLEVTESVMVGHVERAIRVLNALRDLGVKLALDDFGTGYSSLSYLHLLPLDSLKADRSFVNRHHESAGEALLRAISGIAVSLGLKTVAEGIETDAERVALRGLGYDLGQGYYFSKPVTLPELAELLEVQRARG